MEDGDPELVAAIKERRWREVAGLSDVDRALCTVAEKLSARPTRMTEADWEPLRRLALATRGCSRSPTWSGSSTT